MEGIVTLTLGGRRGTKATMSTLGNQVDWEDQPAATCDSRRSIRSWKSKTAAFRREFELILLPVGSLSASMTCSLCSTGITPLHHYYGAVRPWSAHQYFRPRGWAACAFSLRIADQVLKFHVRAQMRVTPPIHRTPYGQ
jgi:hypothetical protein